MKPETIWLGSQGAKQRAIKRINEQEINGAVSVRLVDTKSKSIRCRGLQWMWNTEVADSGLGRYDTKIDVHRAAKWKWAVPILLRDDQDFCDLWPELLRLYESDADKMKYIVDHFVSTEGAGFAIGEYLTDFQRYWSSKGVALTIPEDGLLDWANERAA